jgi:hypothetical protein
MVSKYVSGGVAEGADLLQRNLLCKWVLFLMGGGAVGLGKFS